MVRCETLFVLKGKQAFLTKQIPIHKNVSMNQHDLLQGSILFRTGSCMINASKFNHPHFAKYYFKGVSPRTFLSEAESAPTKDE